MENNSPKLGTIFKPDGSYTCSPKDALNTLADQLLGTEVPNTDNTQTDIKEKIDEINLDEIFNKERVGKAILELKKKKCPGKDGITNGMISDSKDIIEEHLLTIFKSCMAKGYVPKIWQNSNGTKISKPGKTDYTKAISKIIQNNYTHPTSLN